MQKIGKQTIKFDNPPSIIETASIVGPKEANGPIAKYFDTTLEDEFWGEKSWEKAESKIIKHAAELAINKSGIPLEKLDYCLAGDLLNQCISSSFGLREINIPYFGIFGACSTFAEGMILSSILAETGAAENVLFAVSSHFCSAEKQFRFPLELGNQRPPSSQWTVTGAGAAIISKSGKGPYITYATPGKIVDKGIKDANNMGAAMAPAAVDTLLAHFKDTGRNPSYYDAIITGDLGHIGKEIVTDMMMTYGYNMKSVYNDCGVLIFDKEKQDTHSGGSGCACSAVVFSGYLYKMLQSKKYKRVLFIATGALTNSTTAQQGESIPRYCTCSINRNLKGFLMMNDFLNSLNIMDYVWCFVIGGAICVIGQVIIDKTKLTPARILVLFVTLGAVLGGLGVYDYIIDLAGAGATVPITGFGANLAKGAIKAIKESGLLGAFIGGTRASAGGIAAAIFFGYIASLISKPKMKKQ